MRLLYHAASGKGHIGREREDHRFGFRRAAIFRRHQADLGLLLSPPSARSSGTSQIASPSQIQGQKIFHTQTQRMDLYFQ